MSGTARRATGKTNLEKACASGDHRQALEELRDALAYSLTRADPNVVAQVAARLQAVLTQIAGLPAPKELSTSDDLERKRAARRTKAARRASAVGDH